MAKGMVPAVLTLLLVLSLSDSAAAQATGTISGVVTDEPGSCNWP